MSRVVFGLRFRLLLLVLLVCAPLVGLTLQSASKERRREMAAWCERARQLARLARRDEERLIREARQLLLAVSESAAVRSADREACKRSLDEMFASISGYANLSVIRPNGEVVASVFPVAAADNPADRAYFRRVLQKRTFSIGNYSVASTNARPVVVFGCPVFGQSNQVQAVVVAWMGLDRLTGPESEVSAEVPAGANWTVIDGNRRILVSYPTSESPSTQRHAGERLRQAAFSQRYDILEAPDARGNASFYAFAPFDSHFLAGKAMTILGVPKSILFAAGNRALVLNLSWIGAAASLALALGWVGSSFLIVRPVKALVRASARLATGDLSTRTGLRHGKDELGQLTRTFDHMAQTLEQRELERQLAAETLQTRDNMIRELPLLPAAVCVCNQKGAVELYNRTAVELWGYEPARLRTGQRFCGSYRLFYADGTPMPHDESPMAEVLRTAIPLRNRELVVERPDGSRVPVLANVVPLRNAEGSMIGAVSCLQDITDRKRAEEKLQESNDKLQLLSHRLVESQETERRHIARELHDEVGQTLTVAEMNLQAVLQSPRAASVPRRVNESLQAVERVLGQVRDLSLTLRPSMLDDLGLEPTLRWYTSRQASLGGFRAEFQAEPLQERLDPAVETACFRVGQEALTNVVRHAQASAVAVEIRKQDGHLHLFVRDDGVGFDVAALRDLAVRGRSMGLLSMEERATLADGGLECKSAPGQGTEVHAWFPLKWRAPTG